MEQLPATNGFSSLGLSKEILDSLNKNKITEPTPIQAQSIPVAITGQDIMGIAQTGTGKTYAFTLPILMRLLANPKEKALIILPTRELALQVEESIKKITRTMPNGVRSVCLIGGIPPYRQIKDLKLNPRILIGTPGRIFDHLSQKKLDLAQVTVVVLDEADRMLDMGFAPQIKRILDVTPTERHTMCFSATMEPKVAELANTYMIKPVSIRVGTENATSAQIEQEFCYLPGDKKNEILHQVLQDHQGKVLVFTRTKHGAKKLSDKLREDGHTSTDIHSNKTLSQRRQALDGFKNHRYRVLVATDVAARGIDVLDIALVVNYDLPDVIEDYVHRIGRTGRAGKTGKAISFALPEQARDVKGIERLVKTAITISSYSIVTPRAERSYNGSYSANAKSSGYSSRSGSGSRSNFSSGSSSRSDFKSGSKSNQGFGNGSGFKFKSDSGSSSSQSSYRGKSSGFSDNSDRSEGSNFKLSTNKTDSAPKGFGGPRKSNNRFGPKSNSRGGAKRSFSR